MHKYNTTNFTTSRMDVTNYKFILLTSKTTKTMQPYYIQL